MHLWDSFQAVKYPIVIDYAVWTEIATRLSGATMGFMRKENSVYS